MPIIQVNFWECEVCGYVSCTYEKTSPYSDPVVTPPEGEEWGYTLDEKFLACPKCKDPCL